MEETAHLGWMGGYLMSVAARGSQTFTLTIAVSAGFRKTLVEIFII
jgi:hypothetical protein